MVTFTVQRLTYCGWLSFTDGVFTTLSLALRYAKRRERDSCEGGGYILNKTRIKLITSGNYNQYA